MAFMCLGCTTPEDEISFDTLKELKVHEMTGHPRPERELPPSPPVTPSKTELAGTTGNVPTVVEAPPPVDVQAPLMPLRLQYKWEGQCEKCRENVKTIEVDLGEKNMIIAYCPRDDTKWEQEMVIPIKEQIGEREDEDEFQARMLGKKKTRP